MPVHFIIRFTVKPDSVSAFRSLLADVKASLPHVEGCKSIQVLNQLDQPLVFTLVEAWDTQAQHGAHVAHLIDSRSWAAVEAHLAAAPTSAYFNEL
ncbi:MAG: putative quinol monooxygenase [Gammaproteobacteria bacterium]